MMMAAALQLLAGAMRLGRFIQLIPRPVIAGFLSGIGLTILCTQLPVVLGYEVSHREEGGALGAAVGDAAEAPADRGRLARRPAGRRRRDAGPAAALAQAAHPADRDRRWRASCRPPSAGRAFGCSASSPPVPGAVAPGHPLGRVERAGDGRAGDLRAGSLESLLSASVVDSLDKDHATDNDQELIGQGLGNLASALFGGLPVTGVIARSATNIQAGGAPAWRRVLHALLLLAMMLRARPTGRPHPAGGAGRGADGGGLADDRGADAPDALARQPGRGGRLT